MSVSMTRDPEEEIHDYLLQLDMLREHCERTGDFVKAQECVNKMRDVNLKHAKFLEVQSRKKNVSTKAEIAEQQKMELLRFSKLWDQKLSEYDAHASDAIHNLKISHMEDYREQEGILKVQLMNKRPRFSKTVMDVRNQLEKCIHQRRYLEAEELKKKLSAQENYELAVFDDSLAVTFEKKAHVLKHQYKNELQAVEQKVKMGRDELLSQRKLDFDRLLRRHSNVLKEMDSSTRLHVTKARQYIQRQVKALVQDPLKTGIDLRGVSETIKQGAALNESRQRQRRSHSAGASRRNAGGILNNSYNNHHHNNSSTTQRQHSIAETSMDSTRYGW